MNKREILKVLREINVCGYEIGPNLVIWVHRGPYTAVKIDPKTVDRTKSVYFGILVSDSKMYGILSNLTGYSVSLIDNCDGAIETADRLRSQLAGLNRKYYHQIKRAKFRQNVASVKNFIWGLTPSNKTQLKLIETVYNEMQIEAVIES